MPGYAPVINNVPAELTANALNSFGDSIAGGMQQFRQNNMMAQQAMGKFLGAAQSNPDMLKFLSGDSAPPELSGALSKLQKGGTLPVQQAALLAQFADTYTKGKEQQQQMQVRQAQIDQANAQTADIASQAKSRDLQNQILTRKQKMVEDIFNQKNPDSPLTNDAAGPQPISFHAPTAPEPTRKGVFMNLVQSTADIPDAKTTDEAYRAQHAAWADISRPLGFVRGGQEKDKEGKDVQNWYPVAVKNNQEIVQAKDPLKTYLGVPAPGPEIDGKTFTPVPQQAPQAGQAGVPPINLSEDAKKDLIDGSNNLQRFQQSLALLNKMDAVNAAMKQKRAGGMSGLTGGSFINNTIEPMMGDTTGQQFNALSGSLYQDAMAGIKNIRNQFEFNATTGNIPKADQAPATRDTLLADTRQKIMAAMQRTQTAIGLIQKGVEPDSAWLTATPNSPRETVGKAITVGRADDILKKYGVR